MLRSSILSLNKKQNSSSKKHYKNNKSKQSKNKNINHSKDLSKKKNFDYSLNLYHDFGHKKTRSSSTHNSNLIKSDLLQFASIGKIPIKSKIKTGRTQKKDQYFSTRVNQIENKKRYQPTPILTPIISQRNSNCPATIRDMEDLNNKESQKLNFLKKHIHQDQQKIKTAKKRVQGLGNSLNHSRENSQLSNNLKLQLKSAENAIQQSAKRYRSLINTHKNQIENLNKQIFNINERLKHEVQKRNQLQNQLQQCQKQINTSKNVINQKSLEVQNLKCKNDEVNHQNCEMKNKIDKFSDKIDSLEKNIIQFEQMRKQMEGKLKKAEQEKKYIKKNTEQVLKMLRQDFGSAFGKITKQPKQTEQFLGNLDQNY